MEDVLTPQRLAELLRELYEANDARLRADFHRSLPFQDAAFDRWQRAARLGFGEGASVYNSALIYGEVRVGRRTWIGPNTLLDGSGGGLHIGSFCSISAGVQIYTHDTMLWALSGGVLAPARAAVTLGDCIYIGSQSIVAAGVKIGSHSVIGANSFVNGDIPERTVFAGSPARQIGVVAGDGERIRVLFDRSLPR